MNVNFLDKTAGTKCDHGNSKLDPNEAISLLDVFMHCLFKARQRKFRLLPIFSPWFSGISLEKNVLKMTNLLISRSKN